MLTLRNDDNEYIFVTTLDDEDMNSSIVNRIDELGDAMNHATNVKADCTLGNMHEVYPEFEKLSQLVLKSCHDFTYDLQTEHPNHVFRYNNEWWYNTYIDTLSCNVMWGTRYNSGEITTPHDHWPATFAFTYYINPPEDCSGLVFPNMDYELKVENGMLVIFRGHMIHETVSKQFEGHRYCVAGTVVSNPSQKTA